MQNAPQYTLQGILPPQPSIPPPPGLALDGLRETGNASTATAKPTMSVRNVSPDDGPAVGSNGAPNNGAIGSAYGAAAATASPVVPVNGHEDRSQQQQTSGQPKFAATLSDLMSSFKSVGLKGPSPTFV